MMRPCYLFLLVYLLGSYYGTTSARSNVPCARGQTCGPEGRDAHHNTSTTTNTTMVIDPATHFLQCVGLPSTDTGRDHMRRLKQIVEALTDVYTFMRSSMTGVPFLSVEAMLDLNDQSDPLQNEALVEMWMEVKIKPLLKSITKHFLSCLSTKSFSCSTYQTMVKELSHHFSEMNPMRQRWIYTFFMYPFLSGDRVAGCVKRNESSEDWLMKNFGAFSVMARVKDFSTLNMVFSGLEVLHLLSPAQKAELLMNPHIVGFNNGTLNLVFHSLMTGGSGPHSTTSPGGHHNWTTPGHHYTSTGSPGGGHHNWTTPGHHYTSTVSAEGHPTPTSPLTYPGGSTYDSYRPTSAHHTFNQGPSLFGSVFRPISSFVRGFVSFTKQRNVSEIRSTTLTQFLLNWTLAELAQNYRPQNTSEPPERPQFDETNVEDWYQHVVMPMLRNFLDRVPVDMIPMVLNNKNLTLAFHHLFYLENGMDSGEENQTSEIQDVCSISLDKHPCGLTDAVVNVARVVHCAARADLTMSEDTVMTLVKQLTQRLNSLMGELATANFTELAAEFREIFSETEPPSLTQEHLNDPDFIKLWFKIKLLPLLPDVPVNLLSCLSTKNFSCPVYQTIVEALGKEMSSMDAGPLYDHNIYAHFIYPFLLHHNTTDAQCVSSANNSVDWLQKNVGFFSVFGSVTDFYQLHPNFSGLEVLPLLSPKQRAQMLLLPLRPPPDKDNVIDRVFDFLLESPEDRKYPEVLHYLVHLAMKVGAPCAVYRNIFEQLYNAIPSLPLAMEPITWDSIEKLIRIAPDHCVPENVTCPVTQFNENNICKRHNSSDLESYLNQSVSHTNLVCSFPLEKYACAKLENFTAYQLATLFKCDLPGNNSHSKALWKMLLTKQSLILDSALDILANTSMTTVSPSAPQILDVIGEIRVSFLTDEELRNSSVIRLWFSRRLRAFLPAASGRFLHCLIGRNMTCHSYRQILQAFSHVVANMTEEQQHVVLDEFILRFLSQPQTGPGCVSGFNSSEWLKENLGSFSELLSLEHLLHLNPTFNPLEALQLLSPKQIAEMLMLDLPTLPDKGPLINILFDFLTESPGQMKFNKFLSFLPMVVQQGNFSCSSIKTLFTRMDLAVATAPLNTASIISHIKLTLSLHIPLGCVIYRGQCNITLTNATDICIGVNSTLLQLRLDNGQMDGHFCDFSVEEFACASLSALKAQDLAVMLKCSRSSNSSGSIAQWKLLLTKASHVLDDALDLLANMTLDPTQPALSLVLDAIREIRLDTFSLANLNHPAVIQLWFKRRLVQFLPAVSKDFLSCLSTKGLNCSAYQEILQAFSHVVANMTEEQQHVVLDEFILRFLSQPQTGPGCVSGFNSSEWLKENLGSFSELLSLEHLLHLNPTFNPLEALQLLSPKQIAEMLMLDLPTLPDKGPLINILFDFLMESPGQMKFNKFLSFLPMVVQQGNFSCSSIKTLFTRMDLAVATAPLNTASIISHIKLTLSLHIPLGCVIYRGQCNITLTNETDLCIGVNSTLLQLRLDNGQMDGHFCDFSVEEFACASLSALKAQDLAVMLKCSRSSNSSGSIAQWKLLLTKASHVLDDALDLLANMTLDPTQPALSLVLDAIREIRLDTFSLANLNHPAVIQLWFKRRLVQFLPAVSKDFLSCLSTKGLNCSAYQEILQAFSHVVANMTEEQQHVVLDEFILRFLSQPQTGPGCVSGFNSSEWLKENLGPFSELLSLEHLLHLNPTFNPLEALQLLSPKQIAEMLMLDLPTLPDKGPLINILFDFLTESPGQMKFNKFLSFLPMVVQQGNFSCSSIKTLFTRMDLAVATAPLNTASIISHIKLTLSLHIPLGCVIYRGQCNITLTNATDLCIGVNSTLLQLRLDNGQMDGHFCDFSVEEFACASLSALKAQDLAVMLKCSRSSNSSGSIAQWKLLLTKASHVLDDALDLLANMTLDPTQPALSLVLDAIREIRLDTFSLANLNHPAVIQLWFKRRLVQFLPAVSKDFLSCLSTKGLNCSAYQEILQAFSHVVANMTEEQQHVVLDEFILRFLSQPQTGPGCVSGFNSSEWLKENLGPFSELLSLEHLLHLNPTFNPLEALQLLSPKQIAEMLMLDLPTLPDKGPLINILFDFLTESPGQMKFNKFLSFLPMVVQQGNFSCSSIKTLFTRMDLAVATAPLNTASIISHIKLTLSLHIPLGCVIYRGQCNITLTNETDLCIGVNSTLLQLRLDNGQMDGHFCDFSVEEFACASLSALKAQDLAVMLKCSRSSNSSGSIAQWKLLLTKASHVLDDALDLLANMTLDPTQPALSLVLDAIREIRLDTFSLANLNHPAVIQLWFKRRLGQFLPAVSKDFLSCLSTKGLNCSAYQEILQILSGLKSQMPLSTQMVVFTHFIQVFLTRNDTADPICMLHINNSGEWLQKNLGAFSDLVTFSTLLKLYPGFAPMEALQHLSVRQLAEVASMPGQLQSPAQVVMVMDHVPSPRLAAFFDDFSPAIMSHGNVFPHSLRSAMLDAVFQRANLSHHSVNDSDVLIWLHDRMRPLLVGLDPNHVAPFFSIVSQRHCNTEQQGIQLLNSTISTLSEATKKEIHDHIIETLKGGTPLRCYGNNYNHSFYVFLEDTFQGFQFPNLTSFVSLMPHDRMPQLLNSMPPSDLGAFLRRPDTVDNDALLCAIYHNYDKTQMFLEKEDLPATIRRPTLPCVWPLALTSSNRSEVDEWFDRSLRRYLTFLTKTLISPSSTYNASCLAFQKLVSVMGHYNYTAADFVSRDVFESIRVYLTSASNPRCYNATDPELNSTAWFAEYIGFFFQFLTLDDLLMLGSPEVIQVFTVNPVNIALLNHSSLPLNLTNYYTELIYLQDSNFNPLLLPLLCRCVAPGPAFMQLTAAQTLEVLSNLTTLCTDLDPQIAAALSGNFGENIDSSTITALGKESSGLSTGQINMMSAEDLMATLGILSTITDWNEGQAMAIIRILTSTMTINNASSLFMLGSLVSGVPSSLIGSISGSELINAGGNSEFVSHLMSAPEIVQQIFVTMIIQLNRASDVIVDNVPDDLASAIPSASLLGFSDDSDFSKINQKKWESQQAELFFGLVAAESATSNVRRTANLSPSVLQGFTCTSVKTLQKAQIKTLILSYRRTNKVNLEEHQLTCMYNHIKLDSDITSYELFPPELLLYYDYSLVPASTCRTYFEQLSEADFSVFSDVLSYKRTALFDNARSCLGITTTSLSEDQISVLGNMCCTLNGTYIENSDPSILEKLKNCPDLSKGQAAAVESLLLSGRTKYGAVSTWDTQTLKDLGMLPLYMTSNFYGHFTKRTKRKFLRYYLGVLKENKVSRSKRGQMKTELRKSVQTKAKRSVECTVGEISQVTISDKAFPFDYDDTNQFDSCLGNVTVKNNFAAITEKVDEEEFLKIILMKLNEAFISGPSVEIPEEQVQLMGPASRVATVLEIHTWQITKIDTLSALMDPSDGTWDPSLSKVIISKYLSTEGNSLGSAELNAIGGVNLCSLDVDVLKTITEQSLRNADRLDVSNCTLEKKKVLFNIAENAFSSNTRSTVPVSTFQLMTSYLGGASPDYVRSLASSSPNMDMPTFVSLDENVVLDLTVNDVTGLLGTNTPELKSYENQALVRNWISKQKQTELDKLGLGLTGGTVTPTVTPSSAAPVAPTTAAKPTTRPSSATTASTTKGNGPRLQPAFGLFIIAASVLILLAPF